MTDTDIAMTVLLVVIAGTMGVAYYAVKGWGEALTIANETVKHHNELLKEALELYEEYDLLWEQKEIVREGMFLVSQKKATVVYYDDGSFEFVPVK